MSHLPYWDQLTRLKLYSLERRRERYQIIYTWRIIDGQVPNFDCTPIQSYKNPRRGRECRVPTISPSATCAIQTIRFSSLPSKGPRLFNVLPKHLRDMSGCSTERFKGELDRYLETIPDEPFIPGLTQYRRCDSNSVIDWEKSPNLHQQNNQLQETNYPELDEVVTTWWPVGFQEHYWVIPSEWVHWSAFCSYSLSTQCEFLSSKLQIYMHALHFSAERSYSIQQTEDYMEKRNVCNENELDNIFRGYPAKRALSVMRKHGG